MVLVIFYQNIDLWVKILICELKQPAPGHCSTQLPVFLWWMGQQYYWWGYFKGQHISTEHKHVVCEATLMNQKAITVQDAWSHQASYSGRYSCAFQMLMIQTSKWDMEVMLYYINSRETEAKSQMTYLALEFSIWKGKKKSMDMTLNKIHLHLHEIGNVFWNLAH